ncbi:glycosyltransferase involved in cell wall biogenesis [Gynuella sunshinyii YC6258]|uniref:Glycosyltransferase involved in cell wall biogenesis n=2 Tax=Gynuella sunshinyii TaxID=1445505 RepID=A0A0C5UZU0_9GAMM|nr:glycosyltransferase involved in cell wall biogenesis [Gynuella sunshinyii YC6258]
MRITLDSVVAQTAQPDLWVIVDDGSTDETPVILKQYAEKHSFIKVITRQDRGHRSVGPGVIEAFYHGYDQIDVSQFDFVCKFDLDLDLPPRYFETLIERMNANPRIGTCSGKAYFRDQKTGELVSEKCGDEMSVGMTKFYRRSCFEEIGGFVRQVMWDGIDCHKCRQLGWIAVSWDEPDLRFIHLRPMGSSQKGIFTGRMRHGFGQYFMGTGLLYMTASSVFRLFHPPYLVGGLAMWWGYVKSMLQKQPRFADKELVQFIREYQTQCLLKGKTAATEALNRQQEVVWKTTHS